MAESEMDPKDAMRLGLPAALYAKIERHCPDADWNGIGALFKTGGSAAIASLSGHLDLLFPEAKQPS